MSAGVRAGYKQTEVGVIPEDWAVANVGDAFEICNNLRLPISSAVREKMQGDFPYYGPTSIQGWINEFRVDGEHALIGEDGDHFLKWRTQPMTLLVQGRFNVNNHAHLVCGSSNLTAWFYWYFVNRDITASLSRQGASRYKLNKATLIRLQCVLPPLLEQRAIATALSDVDALLSGLDSLTAKKQNLKQAAMQQLLTGQTRLPGFSGEWEVKRLGDVVEIKKGQLITEKTVVFGDIPVIAGGKKPAYFHNQPNRVGKTITVSASGASAGYVALFDQPVFASDCSTISQGKDYSIEFICFQMQLRQDAIYRAQTGGAQPHIHAVDLAPIEIDCPELPEQTAIAAVLSDMDTELAALQARRDKTRALKQGMMQELLTGRIRLI